MATEEPQTVESRENLPDDWASHYSRQASELETGKISALALLLCLIAGCAFVWLLARLG